MTREEFKNIKKGDFVSDRYNGIAKVFDVYGEEKTLDITCVFFNGVEWEREGVCFDVDEEEAVNGDRWEVMSEEEVKAIEADYIED